MFRGEQPSPGTWRHTDRLLFLGLELYERNIHQRCGQPLIFSLDKDARGHYPTKTVICQACAAMDKAARAEEKKTTQTPGQVRFVEPDEALRYAMNHPTVEQGGSVVLPERRPEE